MPSHYTSTTRALHLMWSQQGTSPSLTGSQLATPPSTGSIHNPQLYKQFCFVLFLNHPWNQSPLANHLFFTRNLCTSEPSLTQSYVCKFLSGGNSRTKYSTANWKAVFPFFTKLWLFQDAQFCWQDFALKSPFVLRSWLGYPELMGARFIIWSQILICSILLALNICPVFHPWSE